MRTLKSDIVYTIRRTVVVDVNPEADKYAEAEFQYLEGVYKRDLERNGWTVVESKHDPVQEVSGVDAAL